MTTTLSPLNAPATVGADATRLNDTEREWEQKLAVELRNAPAAKTLARNPRAFIAGARIGAENHQKCLESRLRDLKSALSVARKALREAQDVCEADSRKQRVTAWEALIAQLEADVKTDEKALATVQHCLRETQEETP